MTQTYSFLGCYKRAFSLTVESVNYYAPDSVKESIRLIGTGDIERKFVEKERTEREDRLKVVRKFRVKAKIEKDIRKLDELEQNRKTEKKLKKNPPARLVEWKKSILGTLSGRVYGSKHNVDGEWIVAKHVVSGTARDGSIVHTFDGRAYLLCTEV